MWIAGGKWRNSEDTVIVWQLTALYVQIQKQQMSLFLPIAWSMESYSFYSLSLLNPCTLGQPYPQLENSPGEQWLSHTLTSILQYFSNSYHILPLF